MPELPEIESIRRSLAPLVGQRVLKMQFSNLAPIETTTAQKIKKAFLNSQIRSLDRHGKYLIIKNQGAAFIIHLGMSGQLRLHAETTTAQKHTHFILHLDSGQQLHFIDARRFGTLSLSQHPQGEDNAFLQRLGPDYLDPRLTENIFLERCRSHPKISLKSLTLDQRIASGLGNIYACEALYDARLDPRRLVGATKPAELAKLLRSSQAVLQLGVEQGGTSLRDYINGLGHRGVMQNFLKVYGREGKLSLDRRAPVHRIVQNARSTFYCPDLQK